MPEQIDVAIHIPLELEFQSALQVFKPRERISDDPFLVFRVDAPSNLNVVVMLQDDMGRRSATALCAYALAMFIPKLYICLGIAGGISKDLHLGDVCYTGDLLDVTDNSKIIDSGSGGVKISFEPDFYETDSRLTKAMGYVRTIPDLHPLRDFWAEDQ